MTNLKGNKRVIMSAYPYPDREEIQAWIEWTRANLPTEGDIPYLDWGGPAVETPQENDASSEHQSAGQKEPPWTRGVPDVLEESALGGSSKSEQMLGAFTQAMLADLYDLAPRFTALHFYYTLATDDSSENSMYNKDIIDEAQIPFFFDLKTLVSKLPVDECPHDLRRVKWEISNALATVDWDRAQQLFKLAEAFNARKDRDLWILRGQFNFFVAFDRDEEKRRKNNFWILNASPLDDIPVLQAYRTALVRAPEEILSGTLDKSAREMLRDARNDFEKALQKRSDLDPSYYAMLGTCYFALGDYAQAADAYSRVLDSETALRVPDADMLRDLLRTLAPEPGEDRLELLKRTLARDPYKVFRDFKPDLLRALAKSHALAGESARAEAVYRQWEQEYEKDQRAYRDHVELLRQQTKYVEAYEPFRKGVDLKLETEQEPAEKLARALGEIAVEQLDLDRFALQALENHPEVERLLDQVLLDLWHTYSKMGDKTRKIWRLATVLTNYLPSYQPTIERELRQIGAATFAKAVEIELRQRVFEGFRNDICGNTAVTAAAEQVKKEDEASRLAEFLVRKGKLTLGEMAFILRKAKVGKDELFKYFGKWISQHFPRIDDDRLKDLEKIRIPRNQESHTAASLDVTWVPELCRRFLDALLATAINK
jgi:tetratricopeptide (TPR) repeat protein